MRSCNGSGNVRYHSFISALQSSMRKEWKDFQLRRLLIASVAHASFRPQSHVSIGGRIKRLGERVK